MKKTVSLLLALILALSLCAFASADDRVEVEFWYGLGGATGEIIKNTIEEFNAMQDKYTIVGVTKGSYTETFKEIQAPIAAHNPPALTILEFSQVSTLANKGALQDLTDYIANSEVVDMDNYYADINALYSKDGKNYAVAKDHDTIALLYNKALFDQYGVAYPDESWTWDDYKAAAEAITEASGGSVYGAACNTTNDQDGYFNIIYDFGGYVISEDRKSSGWDNENTIAAMNFVGSLMEKAWAPQPLVAENGTDTLFNNRKVAMISQGSWMINSFYTYEGSEDYAWAVLPYADVNGNGQADEGERCSIYNGLGWAASAATKDPDAAWSLIEWFSSEAMQLKQSELGVTMAGYVGASDAFINAFPGMDVSAFLKMETEGTLVFRPYSKYTSRWADQYQRGLVEAWNNPAVMTDVLYSLAGQMNALLAQE